MHALHILRRHWKWALVGVLPAAFLGLSTAYHVGPSGIHRKSLVYGAAQTQLLVDSPQSTIATAGTDVTPLAARAQVFAQFFQTQPVRAEMAKLLGVSPDQIAVSIPNTNPNLPTLASGPSAGQANSGLLQENDALQLLVVAQPDLPLISLYTQGPTGRAAAALANDAARALHDYVRGMKAFTPTKRELALAIQQGGLPPSRVTVRQLGIAQGRIVDAGASRSIAALAFLGLVVLDCILVIVIGGFAERARERRALLSSEAGKQIDTPAAVSD